MGVSEIRPGMVGIGRTVFEGTRVEEFKAHILGVIENVIGTQRNLILARLEGGPLANTGVIAGMSGSPVYIDGRLIGAVSYALGSFSKEPIAGITPIAEMTDATSFTGAASGRGARQRGVSAHARRPHRVVPQGTELEPSVRRSARRCAAASAWIGSPASAGAKSPRCCGRSRRRCHVRLRTRHRRHRSAPRSAIRASSRWAPPRGSRAGDMPFDGPLKPGDAVGVTFVTGDLELGATGTVTHIDGDKVYAFGHPMYNLGPTEFPMTRAYVYTVLPSLFSSAKLSTTERHRSARSCRIARRRLPAGSAPGPTLLPVTMTLESNRGGKRTFKFSVVRDQLFTPLMTYTAIVNTLTSYERQFGNATYSINGKVQLGRYEPIALDNIFAGDNSSSNASAYVVAPLTALINNDYEKVQIDAIDLDDQVHRRTANRDRRARVARRSAAARRTDGAAQGAAADVPRRGPAAHDSDRRFRPTSAATCRSWWPTARGSTPPNSAKRACRSRAACRS